MITHHPPALMVSVRRRRAKCGLIPAVWDLDAILLMLPPILSSLPPANPKGDAGVRQSSNICFSPRLSAGCWVNLATDPCCAVEFCNGDI